MNEVVVRAVRYAKPGGRRLPRESIIAQRRSHERYGYQAMPRSQTRIPAMDAEDSAKNLRRKLAVILASDVAGYSRLVSISEDETIRRFRKAAQTFVALIRKHEGRVFNTAGDAILAEFDSAVNAARCAVDFQSANNSENLNLPQERRLLFRIGLAVGDVIVNDNMDLLGDGVNIAARLQTLAEAGGICISEDIRSFLGNKMSLRFDDLGWQDLRNIQTPVRVFRIALDPAATGYQPSAFRNKQFARVARPATILAVGAVAAVMLITASLVFWRTRNGIQGTPPDSPGMQRFDAAVVPLIRDSARAELADYATRPDAKALAISGDGSYRAAVGLSDPESAKQEALQQCRFASQRVCRLYAVGPSVVWPANLLPLPLASDVRTEPTGVPLAAEIPRLRDRQRRLLDQNYLALPEHKALAMDKSGQFFWIAGQTSRAEAVRLVVERCAAQRQSACLLVAVSGQLTVQIPKSRRPTDIFMVTSEEGMTAQDRQRIGEIYGRKDWRALARGKSGRLYAVADEPSESKAVDAAIQSCAQVDTECKLHAIGNFRVAEE
jgi:class 3 adenylate cyclase